MYFEPCSPGDVVIIVSDGVHDNLDPSHINILPKQVSESASSNDWDQMEEDEKEKLSDLYAANFIKKLWKEGKNTPQLISEALVDNSLVITKSSRDFMDKNPKDKLPHDLEKYPGKMDHTTCLCFVISGDSDLNVDKSDNKLQLVKQKTNFFRIPAKEIKNTLRKSSKHNFGGFEVSTSTRTWETVLEEFYIPKKATLINTKTLMEIKVVGPEKVNSDCITLANFSMKTISTFPVIGEKNKRVGDPNPEKFGVYTNQSLSIFSLSSACGWGESFSETTLIAVSSFLENTKSAKKDFVNAKIISNHLVYSLQKSHQLIVECQKETAGLIGGVVVKLDKSDKYGEKKISFFLHFI